MLKNFCTIIFLLFLLPITTEIGRLSVSAQNYAAEIELDDVICTGNGSNNNYPDDYDPDDYPPGTYNPYDDTYNAGYLDPVICEGGGGSSNNSSSGNPIISSYDGYVAIRKDILNDAIHSAVSKTITEYGTSKACNIGVQECFRKIFGYYSSDLRGRANDIGRQLMHSQSWTCVTKEEAGYYANHNCFVVGCWINSDGESGHVILVVGQEGNNMYVMDTGPAPQGKYEWSIFNNSFGPNKRENVKFYVLKK